MIGAHCGHVLVHLKGASDRLAQWMLIGVFQLVTGLALHFTIIRMNTDLYVHVRFYHLRMLAHTFAHAVSE